MTWSSRTKRDGLDLEQARQDLRDLDPGEAALAGLRIAQADRDRQAERRDVRERVARIDRQRRQDREDLVEEALAERLVVLGDRGVVDELDALGGERAPDRDVDRRVIGDELEDALAGRGQLLVGGPAVGRAGDLAGLDLLAQAGDPDLEELVEVAGEDGQELDPLEQRVALVARLVQDAGVELEPGQLAVQVRVGRLRAGRATGAWRDRGSSGSSGCARVDRGHRRALGTSTSRVVDDGATRPARIARAHGQSSATYRRSPLPGSIQTRIVRPEVGSTKTSSLRRKRGSIVAPGGSPPPGPCGSPERSAASER